MWNEAVRRERALPLNWRERGRAGAASRVGSWRSQVLEGSWGWRTPVGWNLVSNQGVLILAVAGRLGRRNWG